MNTINGLDRWLGEGRARELYDSRAPYVDAGCRPWIASINEDGYGYYSTGNTLVLAHRLAFILFNGDIPDGLHILHLCDNRACVNPDHLAAGTNAANMYDMKRKGLACQGENHPRAKLTTEQAIEIRVLEKYGYEKYHLATMFGVSRSTISKVVNGDSYKKGATHK